MSDVEFISAMCPIDGTLDVDIVNGIATCPFCGATWMVSKHLETSTTQEDTCTCSKQTLLISGCKCGFLKGSK